MELLKKYLKENDIEFVGQTAMEEDEVIACCADADGIALTYPMISAKVIDHMTKCKVIIRNGIGYDNVDIPAATQKGIAVCNIPEFCTEEVAAHALALMMDAQRKTTLLDRQGASRAVGCDVWIRGQALKLYDCWAFIVWKDGAEAEWILQWAWDECHLL